MRICSSKSNAKSILNNFGKKRIVVTKKNLYESFNSLARYPEGSTEYNTFSRYLEELFDRRSALIPTADPPKYIRPDDIPNPSIDYTKYNQFFNELKSSLKNTLTLLSEREIKEVSPSLPNQGSSDDGQMSH